MGQLILLMSGPVFLLSLSNFLELKFPFYSRNAVELAAIFSNTCDVVTSC